MTNSQRTQNPDVNSYDPGSEPGEDPGSSNNPNSDIESGKDDNGFPVPPDTSPRAPVEEPSEDDRAPVGDVDDSPKRIV